MDVTASTTRPRRAPAWRALATLALLVLLLGLAPATTAMAAVTPAATQTEPPLLHSFTFDGADAAPVDGAPPLLDVAGAPLGFTTVQPYGPRPGRPSSTPDQPALRSVAGGDLTLTATSGLQYRSATTGGRGAYNRLDNGLGVPLHAATGPVVLETTLHAPVVDAPGYRQAGLWVGRGQDDVVKLVLSAAKGGAGMVQLVREVGGAASTGASDQVTSRAVAPGGADVSLRLTLDPAAGTIGGRYRLGEAAWTALPATVGLVPALLDDPATDAVEASAGIFASRRDDVSPGPVTFSFAQFSLRAGSSQPPPPPPAPSVAVDVAFSDAAKTPPPGYLRDFGEAYGPRTGAHQGSGLSYGWVVAGTTTPVSLVGNGRDRTVGAGAVTPTDPRLGAVMHMQYPPGVAGGNPTPGAFELAVPPGAYDVEVSVGEPGRWLDSEHWVSIEDQNAVAVFRPTATTRFASARRTVWVGDGRLTLSPANGTNTKINYVSVRSAAYDPATTPRASGVTPQNASVGRPTLSGAVLSISGPNGGVTETSLTPATVRLQRLPDGADVGITRATSAGGDLVSVAPTDPGGLQPATTYRFTVDGVKDERGAAAPPWSSVFTTGATPDGPTGSTFDEVAFSRTALPGTEGGAWTSVAFGPDGRLYASSLHGDIARWTVDPDGTLGAKETITSIRRLHAADGTTNGRSGDERTVIGLAFGPKPGPDPGAEQVLWVSDNITYLGVRNVPEWDVPAKETSGIGYLTVPADPAASVYRRVVEDLPRSRGDHQTNSPVFHQGRLMIPVGANTSTGAPDSSWGKRSEKVLSAAVLALDVRALRPDQVLDVKTAEGGGTYDPYAPGAPLTVYASGVRNAYDLVSHSNGALYAPTNGSGAHGNVPASTWSDTSGSEVREEKDAAYPRSEHCVVGGPYTGPAVPLLTDLPEETDHLFTLRPGRYYGHPDPARCEFVFNGGNPTAATDPFEHPGYPVGTAPDPRYDLAGTFDAGLHASADGALEYRSKVFGGVLRGTVLYTRFSQVGDVVVVTPDKTTKNITGARVTGISGLTGFTGPLDIAEDTRADGGTGAGNGNLYLASMAQTNPADSRITLLRPVTSATPPGLAAPAEAIANDVVGGGAAAMPVTLTNTGGSPLTISGLALSGPGAASFSTGPLPGQPVVVAPGASASVPLTFSATAPGVVGATVTITSDDPAARSRTVALRGLGTAGTSGAGEPSLQRVVDVLGYPVDVGDPDPATTELGSAAPLGREVPLQRMVAATDAPVGVRLLAAFGVAGSPTATVGWHADGSVAPADRHELLAVPADSAQSVRPSPAGTTTFDPGDASFGLYGSWPPFFSRHGQGYAASTQDALNTWDPAVAHHVRAYPVPGQPSSYLVAMEEHTSGFDFQDVVLLVTNVAPAPASGSLALTSVDGVTNSATAVPAASRTAVPGPGRVVLSRVGTKDAEVGDAQRTHDAAPVRVTNTGTAPARVTSLSASDGFSVTTATALPTTLAPGAALDATVTFTHGRTDTVRNEVVAGTLTATGDVGTATLDLTGTYQRQSERGDEPSLQQILGAYGWSTKASARALAGGRGAYQAVGDEVLSPFWRRADAAAPIRLTQLAAYHGCCTTGGGETLSTYPQVAATAPATVSTRVRHGGLWGQSLLPAGTTGERLAQGVLSPAADQAFGIRIGNEWSDPARNDGAKDVANGCTAAVCGHHVRFFPVIVAGATVPGTYVVTMDYSGINYDFQDNVYLMENVRPA